MGRLRVKPRPAPFELPHIIEYSSVLARSFSHLLKRDLIKEIDLTTVSPEVLARKLYYAPFVLVSHGTQADPVFRYANLAAQKLFGYSWDEFISTPSRLSAEPMEREERQKLLDRAARDGYVDDYHGVRVTKDGKRFEIRDTILWNVTDEAGKLHGQAAMFSPEVRWL